VERGQLSKERLVLKALTSLNVGDYAIFRSRAADDKSPTSGPKSAYWFPDLPVAADDLIVLYTKKGSQSTKILSSGRVAHFFYWNREEAIWGDYHYGAVIVLVSDWEFQLPRT
jgi:hypothetical protein